MAHPKYVLNPKRGFWIRKIAVWCFIGPFNPVSWALIAIFENETTVFSLVAFITIWPCSLGSAIALLRLDRKPIAQRKLVGFVCTWAVLTIPIYASTAYFWLAMQPPDGPSIGFDFSLVPQVAAAMLVIAILALLPGIIPAMTAALMSFWTVRYALFEAPNPPNARPSRCRAASSEQ